MDFIQLNVTRLIRFVRKCFPSKLTREGNEQQCKGRKSHESGLFIWEKICDEIENKTPKLNYSLKYPNIAGKMNIFLFYYDNYINLIQLHSSIIFKHKNYFIASIKTARELKKMEDYETKRIKEANLHVKMKPRKNKININGRYILSI